MDKRLKIACLSTHPIQYQAPLFRTLAQHPVLDLNVLFLASLDGHFDRGFRVRVAWDIPLLNGYAHEFLPCVGSRGALTFWRPWTYGLLQRLRTGGYDGLLIHGYAHRALLWAIAAAHVAGIHVLLRGDSQLGSERCNPLGLHLKHALLPRLFELIDGFLACGSLNRQYYLSYGVPAERIFPMPFAVDNDFFRTSAEHASQKRDQFRSELSLKAERSVILYASKLQPRKRPRDLLEAYARLISDIPCDRRPYLLFVGDGTERHALEARAGELGRESIRFLGFRNQRELPAFFDLADVFVLPSEVEPWGLVVNEVMSVGRPIIVSDRVGAGPDLVCDGVNGFIYPGGDIVGLTDRIARVLANRATATAMGLASLQRIASFSLENNAAALVDALGELNKRSRHAHSRRYRIRAKA